MIIFEELWGLLKNPKMKRTVQICRRNVISFTPGRRQILMGCKGEVCSSSRRAFGVSLRPLMAAGGDNSVNESFGKGLNMYVTHTTRQTSKATDQSVLGLFLPCIKFLGLTKLHNTHLGSWNLKPWKWRAPHMSKERAHWKLFCKEVVYTHTPVHQSSLCNLYIYIIQWILSKTGKIMKVNIDKELANDVEAVERLFVEATQDARNKVTPTVDVLARLLDPF